MTDAETPALRCRGIRVAYGGLVALDDLSIAFARGRIHAVVGQNGAGKTTFARTAAGLVRPDAGALFVDGRALRPNRVADARAAGVELVHQSFALPPSFTVAEALEFGAGGGIGLFSRRRLLARCRARLKALDLDVDPRRRIRDLPVEAQQGVEIARALAADARVLILDEPTAVLPPPGIEALFERLRGLKRRGVTVILILHKVREVLAVADTISVLRGGRLVAGPFPRERANQARIGAMIVGSADTTSADTTSAGAASAGADGGAGKARRAAASGGASSAGAPVLDLTNLSTAEEAGEPPLDRVSLAVRPGEIVGIAGVQGNGQRTLVQAIAGLARAGGGDVRLGGVRATGAGPAARRAAGLRVIPFERNGEGLSLTSPLWENWAARELLQRPLFALVNPAALRRRCDEALKTWGVRYASTTQNAETLSGGNAQKVILAREIDDGAAVIVAAQPARGLDVGAAAFVWSALRAAAARGCGVLLISSDLDELFDVADRLLVMLSGRIVGEFAPPYDIGAVGRAMTDASATGASATGASG